MNNFNTLEIYDRFKFVRIQKKLSQIEFANRIGFRQSNVSRNEKGAQEISDPYIKAVCREFSVNEVWLRTGIGEPFAEYSQEEKITILAAKLSCKDEDSFLKSFLEAIADLNEEQLEHLEIVGKAILNNIKKNDKSI